MEQVNDDSEYVNFLQKCYEVEKNLLTGFCVYPDTIRDHQDKISSAYFLDAKNALLYDILIDIDKSGAEVDYDTIKTKVLDLDLHEKLDLEYIEQIVFASASEKSISYYVDRLINYYQRRQLSDIGAVLFSESRTSNPNIGRIVAETQEKLNGVVNQESDFDFKKIQAPSILVKVFEDIANQTKGPKGVLSGFARLDAVTNGLKPGELIIIAGRPAMGKSTFGMNIVETVGYKNPSTGFKKPLVVFTLEMPANQVMLRSLANLGTINQKTLQTQNITEEVSSRLANLSNAMVKATHVFIDDSSYGLTVEKVRSRVRQIAQQFPDPETGEPTMGLVLVDYLQLLESEQNFRDRHLLIAHIAKSLKALAREFNCPVLALSQLNRNVDTRGEDARPTNADLRESGAIEQDADIVIMVHRPEIAAKAEKKEELRGKAEIIVTKNRQGEIGTLYCRFEGQYSRFFEDDESRFVVG